MTQTEIIDWLLGGDVAIQYQVYRDLLGELRPDLQARISTEGWGRRFLAARHPQGHWGTRFYHPKWKSSHYTLLDLRNLCIAPDHPEIRASIQLILDRDKSVDGGINPSIAPRLSDVCVNGMFLNYAAYFGMAAADLESVVDCLLAEWMPDGGFNCRSNRSGARHSSLHSTISVLEGFQRYLDGGYAYRLAEVRAAMAASVEFILLHRLFLSDRTGEVIDKRFLKFVFPYRWKYDVLRALDCFQLAGVGWDERMQAAVEVLLKKRRKDGRWAHYAGYSGQVHFRMERAGQAGRWNTLRALRVLGAFGQIF